MVVCVRLFATRLCYCYTARALSTMSKPRCYFDVTADGKPLGRIEMEVSAS